LQEFNVNEIISAIGLALAISAGLLWLLLRIASSALPIDRPNERSLHSLATPRVGGIAIMVAVSTTWLWFGVEPVILGIAVALAIISYLDDRSGLPTLARLLTHGLAAVCFVALCVTNVPLWLAIAIIVGTVWMTNLYNFMDGSDGLAGGMAIFGFGTYAFLAWQGGNAAVAVASLAIACASVGFLLFNFPPAKVFMGDAGSIPLGFLAAAIGVTGWQQALWPLWMPIVAFGPFVVDATVTLGKRIIRGEKFWQAHRMHYYQRLVQAGWGHRRTAFAAYCLMAMSAIAAAWGAHQSITIQWALVAVILLAYLAVGAMVDRGWAAHQRRTPAATSPQQPAP
jgi:UDP-N-acetylmuramyl pentapeptide phosphotransferase/UDP-N-acetylglucosamine-1-phosphate transferase